MKKKTPRIEYSCNINSRGNVIKHLIINDKIWMSNDDYELKDIDRAIKYAKGNCLIAGLGLGTILEELIKKPEVIQIDVLEIDKNIVKLWHEESYKNLKVYNKKCSIYIVDATNSTEVKKLGLQQNFYDYYYCDIWLEPTESAKKQMEKCIEVAKPYLKSDAIKEAWLLPKLEQNDFWIE